MCVYTYLIICTYRVIHEANKMIARWWGRTRGSRTSLGAYSARAPSQLRKDQGCSYKVYHLPQITYSLFCIQVSSLTDWSFPIIRLICNLYHSVKSTRAGVDEPLGHVFNSHRAAWRQNLGLRQVCPKLTTEFLMS